MTSLSLLPSSVNNNTSSTSVSEHDDKYDRQLRLWGADGQRKLMQSRILLLYASPSGSETLKNLVLPGVGEICIIDNNLVSDQSRINSLFDILINDTSLDSEISNLIMYKKALYNADNAQESDLLNMLNPLINSKSVWKSHSLYLMAEYFYANNQKQKDHRTILTKPSSCVKYHLLTWIQMVKQATQ